MRTLRAVTVAALALASAGCTMAALREQQSQAARVRYEAIIRDGSAYALKRNVEARGLRSCAIVQHESAFKTEAEEARLTGSSFESERRRSPPLAVSSRVQFSVDRSGAVRMQASSSTHASVFTHTCRHLLTYIDCMCLLTYIDCMCLLTYMQASSSIH